MREMEMKRGTTQRLTNHVSCILLLVVLSASSVRSTHKGAAFGETEMTFTEGKCSEPNKCNGRGVCTYADFLGGKFWSCNCNTGSWYGTYCDQECYPVKVYDGGCTATRFLVRFTQVSTLTECFMKCFKDEDCQDFVYGVAGTSKAGSCDLLPSGCYDGTGQTQTDKSTLSTYTIQQCKAFWHVADKMECDGDSDLRGIYRMSAENVISNVNPATVGECAERCRGRSTMFTFETDECDLNRCECYCFPDANPDGTCKMVATIEFRLYSYFPPKKQVCSTKDGAACVFPFNYLAAQYPTCIDKSIAGVELGARWCGTAIDASKDKDQGTCNQGCYATSMWTPWQEWPKICLTGVMTRKRGCILGTGGKPCSDVATDNTESETCVNGGWTIWTSWSRCYDAGYKHRARTCTKPAPKNRGSDCSGPAENQEVCANGGWSSYSSWSTCSDSGSKYRKRTCTNPDPSNGGTDCLGSYTNNSMCVHGAWSKWTEWECYTFSSKSRSRTCTNPPPSDGGLPCDGGPSESGTCTVNIIGAAFGGFLFAIIIVLLVLVVCKKMKKSKRLNRIKQAKAKAIEATEAAAVAAAEAEQEAKRTTELKTNWLCKKCNQTNWGQVYTCRKCQADRPIS